MENLCKETFLNDVVRLQVFRTKDLSRLPLPCTLPNITHIKAGNIPDTPVLDIAYDEKHIMAADKSLKVSFSVKHDRSTVIYTYIIKAVLEDYVLRDENLLREEHHVVATKQDGSSVLIYALPGASGMDVNVSEGSTTLNMTIKSLNNFIEIES